MASSSFVISGICFTSAPTPSLCSDWNTDSIVPWKTYVFFVENIERTAVVMMHNMLQSTKQQVNWCWRILASVFLSHFDRKKWQRAKRVQALFGIFFSDKKSSLLSSELFHSFIHSKVKPFFFVFGDSGNWIFPTNQVRQLPLYVWPPWLLAKLRCTKLQ